MPQKPATSAQNLLLTPQQIASQKIFDCLKIKWDEISTKPRDTDTIIDGSNGHHFDWYFPNLSANYRNSGGIEFGDYADCLYYDEGLINCLIKNSAYRKLYLAFTRKYFEQAKLISQARGDLAPADLSQIKYDELQGYLVRLDKIIQSYRLLLYYTQKQYNKTKDPETKLFLDELTKTYKAVYKSIISNYEQFKHIKPDINPSRKQTIAQCFENNIDKMVFDYNPRKLHQNQQLINQTKARQFASDVFSHKDAGGNLVKKTSPHHLIEEQVELENRAKGAIYCQAIFDAVGLTTEFMGKKQAKLVMNNAGALELKGDNWDLEINQTHLKKFQENSYQIRRNIYKGEGGLLNANLNHFNKLYSTDGVKVYDNLNESFRLGWRSIVPKGSATDDTDQAFLKFKALKEANGNIKLAQEIYAKDILDWSKGIMIDYFGKRNFGLGGNTKTVIESEGFLGNPEETSRTIWFSTATNIGYIPQANGALMSSSYILQYYPDSLDLAQEATHQLAKVTHYDPVVCAHCVAYITMLYHLQHHKGEISSKDLTGYQELSYKAGEKILDEREGDYQVIFTNKPDLFKGDLDAQIASWKQQMRKAIMGYDDRDGSADRFKSWDELHLVNPNPQRGGDGKLQLPVDERYDNIGMSHRALSAGFFALTKMHHYINNSDPRESLSKKDALTKVCIELIAQGGDADTNGTVVGSLCGSYAGFHEIPKKMVSEFGKGDRGNRNNRIEIRYRDGSVSCYDQTIQETELLKEIIDISSQKIASHRCFEAREIKGSSNQTIAIGSIVKPYYNETLLNKKYKTDQRGIDFTVFDDYKINQDSNDLNSKIDLAKVNQAICDNLILAKNVARLNDFEAEIAIKYARKFGGFSNILDANGSRAGDKIILDEMKKDIGFKDDLSSDLAGDKYNESARNLLEKFKNFSALVQQYNQECGIYSGRKDGKLVGLRLAFVSDEVGVKFDKEIAKQDRQIYRTSLAKKQFLKQTHEAFLNKNRSLKTKIASMQSSSQSRAR